MYIPFEKNEVVITKSFKIDKGRAFSCLFICKQNWPLFLPHFWDVVR